MAEESSYGQIIRSSSIMGGAQAINYLVSLIRVKIVAVLLGPSGVGMIGLYMSATSLLGTVTGLGLGSSAVRSIAEADSAGDPASVARTIRMLRRLCWATGVFGWVVSIALAIPLSNLMFDSPEHASALAILGSMLLLNAISSGQLGLLQGLRRIGDIARMQILAALLNTLVTVCLYLWMRADGIIPVLITNAAISLALSWWFARRVQVLHVELDWSQAIAKAKPLLGLGVAMMWSGVLTLLVDLFTRTLISRHWGVDAAGIYQAAWSLSGLFAGFVLTAMGADFYPRLTAVIQDRAAAIRAVNEQTEIGILLALPGLLGTLVLAKWVVWALFTTEFAAAADVLVWMVIGVFGRVLSWPISFIQLALGASRWYMTTEASFFLIQASLVFWLVPSAGVVGASYAFVACYAMYTIGMIWTGHRLIGFRWSPAVLRIIYVACGLILAALLTTRLLHAVPAIILGLFITLIGSTWCLRGLAQRLGAESRIIQSVFLVPGARYILKRWG